MHRLSKSIASAVVVVGMVIPQVLAASLAATPSIAQRLPKGDVPVLTTANARVSTNSIVHFTLTIHNARGKAVTFTDHGKKASLPAQVSVRYVVDHPTGAFLIPSTASLMITEPGTYHVRAWIDGVASKPLRIVAVDQPAAIQLSSNHPVLVSNGKQLDRLTATVVDVQGNVLTTFNGRATLSPLAHGTYVDPATKVSVSSVRFVHGVAQFDVRAGTTGGVTDTVTLANLGTAAGQPLAYSVAYGTTTIDYTWDASQPAQIELSAAQNVLQADGVQTTAVTATVVDGYGQPVKGFTGVAVLTPIVHGSYVDAHTGAPITTVKFTHGIAQFDVRAGTTGLASDTVMLTNLSTPAGEPVNGAIGYGSLTIDYAWPTNQPASVQLLPTSSVLQADGTSTAVIKAQVVNGEGNVVTTFTGTASLTPLNHGTFVDPTTGSTITSIRFTNGVAQFAIRSATTGGVTDTISLSGLTSGTAVPETGVTYGSTTVTYAWAAAQPASVQLLPTSSVLQADGTSTDVIKAQVVNGEGSVVTTFTGTASLTPLNHGTFVDPTTGSTITSIRFTNGVAQFAIRSATTGGVTDTISLSGLTSGTTGPETGVTYGTTTITYAWAAAQPVAVELAAASPSIVANGKQTDRITATVVDAYGNPVSSFSGSATLSSLTSGSYVDPTTGNPTNTASFLNGVATFEVQAGETGGVNDTVTLSALTLASGQPLTGTIAYGSVLLNLTTPTENAIVLSPSAPVINSTRATEDPVFATIGDGAGIAFTAGTPVKATFTLSGPGSFDNTGSPNISLTEYVIPGVPTVIPVWSVPGQSGQITVTATGAGLNAVSATIAAASSGVANGLSLTAGTGTVDATGSVQAPSLPTGTTFTLYTVELQDAHGNPVVPTTDDPLTVSDNTSTVGGSLQYFAVANGEPSGPALASNQLRTVVSSTSGSAQFAVVNAQEGVASPTLTVQDAAGLTASTAYKFTVGSAMYAVFPLDTPGNLSNALGFMEGGQSTTFTVQLEDANGNPLVQSGQSVDFYFSGRNQAHATINGSSTWTSSAPLVVQTNALGQASVAVAVPAGDSGSFSLNAAEAGSSAVSVDTVTAVGTNAYATQLGYATTLGSQTTITWPTQVMQEQQTLTQYLSGVNPTLNQLYVVPENYQGLATGTGDQLEITTSNPDVLSITPDSNWTAVNGSTFMFSGSSAAALPIITAKQAGNATLTITDLSNPTRPQVIETIEVS